MSSTSQQYLRAPAHRHVPVELRSAVGARTVEVAVLQPQQVSAREGGGGGADQAPGPQASAAVVGHPPSQAARAAVAPPPVPAQRHLRPHVTQGKVGGGMEAGQHVEAQIKDLLSWEGEQNMETHLM